MLVVGADPRGRYLRPLLAVDLADVARRAAEWALRLCDPGVRELPVLHAWDAPHLPLLRLTEAEASRYVADEESVATARLGAWLARHRDLDARLERVLRRGDPRDAILDEAERRAADLIVIGARRRSGIGGLLVGRVAESVVRHASCDVLVVR